MEIEDSANASTYIKLNKHNHVTTTYYLMLKKYERETGKNLVFERVTKEKRSYHSTGNLGNRPTLAGGTSHAIPRGQS